MFTFLATAVFCCQTDCQTNGETMQKNSDNNNNVNVCKNRPYLISDLHCLRVAQFYMRFLKILLFILFYWFKYLPFMRSNMYFKFKFVGFPHDTH